MKSFHKTFSSGFSLIEAFLIIIIMGIAYFGFGYLYGNLDQQALRADLTVLATKLAKEKMEEVVQLKADSQYPAVVSQAPTQEQSGIWTFTRSVNVNYINPADFTNSGTDTGYKKIEVVVSWGVGQGQSVRLTTLATNMIPGAVQGFGFTTCP